MRWLRLRRGYLSFWLGIGFTVLLAAVQALELPVISQLLKRLDYVLYDVRFNALKQSPRVAEHSIVIVDIDEASLLAEGRWPWSRRKVAALLGRLNDAGAAVVAMDVMFSEPERNVIREAQALVRGDPKIQQALEAWANDADSDAVLANQLTESDVVLAYLMHMESSVQVGELPSGVYMLTEDEVDHVVVGATKGFTASLAVLQDAALRSGFITTQRDLDGSIRRSPLLLRHGNQINASLSLATVMLYLFEEKIELRLNEIGEILAVDEVRVGNKWFPTDEKGQVIVPYRGRRGSFPYIPATAVLNSDKYNELLDGSIVLLGTSSIGLADLQTTPVGTGYPGVEVHANIIDGMLNTQFPDKPDWVLGASVLLLCVFGVLLAWQLPRMGPLPLTLVGFSAITGIVSLNFYVWKYQNLDLPLAAQVMLVPMLMLIALIEGFWRESAGRKAIKSMFGQYVPAAHIDQMLQAPDQYNLEGENKELTVLFLDIRGFTTISEQLTAAQLKKLLNDFFTPITEIIFRTHGTIDKYVGDMVMAFWGAPIDDSDHARHAVQAAFEIFNKVDELREGFLQQGLPEVDVGIGINTGHMNVGDMGSSYRRAYTVLGDSVNLASRLEGITRYYDVRGLVGENTKALCSDYLYRLIDKVIVKGKERSVNIYEPICLHSEAEDAMIKELTEYHEALQCYLQQQWDESEQCFQSLRKMHPEVRIYSLYLERISELRQKDLPQDWDGSFRHLRK